MTRLLAAIARDLGIRDEDLLRDLPLAIGVFVGFVLATAYVLVSA